MALETGISYRDWVKQSEINASISFTSSNSELIPLKNATTPRLKQIARLRYSTSSFGFASYNFILDAVAGTQFVDGNHYMSIGCVSLLGLSLPYFHPFRVRIKLIDQSGAIIYDVTSGNDIVTKQNNNFTFILDDIYYAQKAEVILLVHDNGTYPFTNKNIDIGRVWIGNYLEACFDEDYNFSYGDGINTRKSMSFNVSLINESQVFGIVPSWHDFSKSVSSGKELLSSGNDSYPDGEDIIVIPRIDTSNSIKYLSIYGILTKPIQLSKSAGSYWHAGFNTKQLI